MRVLVVDTDYGHFLKELYERNADLESASYDQQLAVRRRVGFGIVHTYARALGRAGHKAVGVYANNVHAQAAWWREHGRRRFRRPSSEAILAAQVREFGPDLLLCLNPRDIDPALMCSLRECVPVVVGQHAATVLPNIDDLGCYDLLVSSFPPTVDEWRAHGYRADYLPLGIDADAVACVAEEPRNYDLVFVGSFFPGIHDSRVRLVEKLCRAFGARMRVWTGSLDRLPADSPIRDCYEGTAWGVEMLAVLARARIVVNHHGDIAPFANNSRLYEATACGALLLTDAKPNLAELFNPANEVVAYEDDEMCVALARQYLSDERARVEIAARGHERTMREHTYDRRIAHLLDMVAGLRR